jgi:hypothetical protein
MLVAAGLGLAGTASVSAAPAGGAAILDAATVTDAVEQAQYWHGRRRSHYRRGSGGFCRVVCRHRGFTTQRVCVRRCG